MQQAEALFAEGSGATEDERKLATQLMRKRAMSHLAEMLAEDAKRTHGQFEQQRFFDKDQSQPSSSPLSPHPNENEETDATAQEDEPLKTPQAEESEKLNEDEDAALEFLEEGDDAGNPFRTQGDDFGKA